MVTRKSPPPPYTWIPAPIGWWFKGKHGRKLSHIWTGCDRRIHAFILRGEDQIPRGPFANEDAAMKEISEELNPPDKTA